VPYQNQGGQQIRQVAKAATSIGTTLFKKSEELRVKNDTARTSEADQMFADYIRNELNPKNGYRSKVGKSAGDTYEQVLESLEAKRTEFAMSLQNPEQREVFNRSSSARMGQARGVVDQHASVQTNIYLGAQQSAAIKGYQADYLDSMGNPKAMIVSMANMRNTVNAQADLVNATPEVRGEMMNLAVSNLHASAMELKMNERDLAGARLYFDINKDELDPAVRGKITAQLDALTKNQDMSDLADHIIGNAPADGTIAEKRQYALDTAMWTVKGKKMSAEDAALLYGHLNQRYNQAKESKAVTNTTLIEQARQQLAEAGTNTITADLPIYKDLVNNNLVAEFDKLRRSTGSESRTLAQVMYNLSKGESIEALDDFLYEPETLTTKQVQRLIDQYGGTTQALTEQYMDIAYARNPDLSWDPVKDRTKRNEQLRRQKVDQAALSLLTDKERAALGQTRSKNMSESELAKRTAAAYRKDRFVNLLLDRVPIGRGVADDDAIRAYEEAIDKAVLDIPASSRSEYLGMATEYDRILPHEREVTSELLLQIDQDDDPETPMTWVNRRTYGTDQIEKAQAGLATAWKYQQVWPAKDESPADYNKRLKDHMKRNNLTMPNFTEREAMEFIEQQTAK